MWSGKFHSVPYSVWSVPLKDGYMTLQLMCGCLVSLRGKVSSLNEEVKIYFFFLHKIFWRNSKKICEKCFENYKELSKEALRSIWMHYIIIIISNTHWAFRRLLFHELEYRETYDSFWHTYKTLCWLNEQRKGERKREMERGRKEGIRWKRKYVNKKKQS